MKVQLTEEYNLKIKELPFELRFEFSRKRGVDKNYWFTPSGKCKIWVGGCSLNHLGQLGKGQYDKLIAMMNENKNDILTDDRDYYTIGSDNIIRIDNMAQILYLAMDEWDERKYVCNWVEDDRPLN